MIRNKKILSFMLAFVMMFSAFATTIVYADKGEEISPPGTEDVTPKEGGAAGEDTQVSGHVKAELIQLTVDGEKKVKGDLTTEIINKYGLKIKEYKVEETPESPTENDSKTSAVKGDTENPEEIEYFEFNNDEKKLVDGKYYDLVVGEDYELVSAKINDHDKPIEKTGYSFKATGESMTFEITIETKVVKFSADIIYPDGFTAEQKGKLELYEEGEESPFDDNYELDTEVDVTATTKYELKFTVIPEGYSLYVKEGNDYKVTENPFTFKINTDTKYEFKVDLSPVEPDKVERLWGLDRYETSVEIAKETYPETDAVILAYGEVSADALTAGPLANELKAPILLVNDNLDNKEVKEYIEESGATKIYVAGGKSSVAEKTIKAVKSDAVKDEDIKRIFGLDRYDTSLEIAKILMDEKSKGGFEYAPNNKVIFANGSDEKDSDALAASTYATQEKMPIVLTLEDSVTDNIKSSLKALEITHADIVGGKFTVSENVLKSAGVTLGERIFGNDRAKTSAKIAEKIENPETFIIANGWKSADALTAGPLANVKNAVILLSSKDEINDEVKTAATSIKNIETAYIAGGKSSVSNELMAELEKIVKNSNIEDPTDSTDVPVAEQ